MIDREARAYLALTLRRLASSRITNDQCDDAIAAFLGRRDRPGVCDCGYDLRGGPHQRCPECGVISDPALPELAAFAASHYSDLETYRLTGRHALSHDERRQCAKAVVFLRSDREYAHHLFGESPTDRIGRCILLAGFLASMIIAPLLRSATAFVLGMLATYALACLQCIIADRIGRLVRRRHESESPEQTDAWPFASASEVIAALRHPLFLAGGSAR